MKKILNFKQWLTIKEAADSLSIDFDERVSSGDIYQLCLDGHLELSIRLMNPIKARRFDRVNEESEDYKEIQNILKKFYSQKSLPSANVMNLACQVSKIISLDNGSIFLEGGNNSGFPISGVFPLAMIGNEMISVEELMCSDKELSTPDYLCIDGFFVFNENKDIIYSILIRNDESDNYIPCSSIDELAGDFVIQTKHLMRFKNDLIKEDVQKDTLTTTFHDMPAALDYANKAYARFWGNMPDPQDRTKHKTNSVIADWIMKDSKGEISETMAKDIAKIIRPEWAAIGRTPEI